MTVILQGPYKGQQAGTLYSGDDEAALIAAGRAAYPDSANAGGVLGVADRALITAASTGQPPLYLGPVTNRSLAWDNFSAANKQVNSEMGFMLMDDVVAVKPLYDSILPSGNPPVEGGPGAPTLITGSVTNPATGTRQAFAFGGNVQGSVPNGGILEGDWTPCVGKRGQRVLVRSFAQNTAGCFWSNRGGIVGTDLFQAAVSGASDATMGGAINAASNVNGAAPMYGPRALLGMTRRGTVFIAGDSIAVGFRDLPSDLRGDLGIIGKLIGSEFGYINGAMSGATLGVDNTGTNYAQRFALSGYCSSAIRQSGNNDMGSGATAGSTAASAATFAAKWAGTGKPVIGCTITPRATSTDGWITTANQTAQAGFVTALLAFNALQRKGIAGEAGYLDLADAIMSDRDSGIFAVGFNPGAVSGATIVGETNTTPGTTLGLHPNQAGNERAARLLAGQIGILRR